MLMLRDMLLFTFKAGSAAETFTIERKSCGSFPGSSAPAGGFLNSHSGMV